MTSGRSSARKRREPAAGRLRLLVAEVGQAARRRRARRCRFHAARPRPPHRARHCPGFARAAPATALPASSAACALLLHGTKHEGQFRFLSAAPHIAGGAAWWTRDGKEGRWRRIWMIAEAVPTSAAGVSSRSSPATRTSFGCAMSVFWADPLGRRRGRGPGYASGHGRLPGFPTVAYS